MTQPLKMLITCPGCAHAHTVEIPREELTQNPSPQERMYKLAEVQELMGVSRRTVKQWIYDKKLRASKPSEGSSQGAPWFVSASALDEFRRRRAAKQRRPEGMKGRQDG